MEIAEQMQARFRAVREHTETLAAPLSPEDQTVQSMPDVSPTKWHRAHVTWFFETFVLAGLERDFTPFQDQYWFLFNSYYEAVGPRHDRAMRGTISRPGAHDVADYRRNVDARFLDLVGRLDGGALEKVAPVVELGFHHEQQHQELMLMDIKHVLSVNPLEPRYTDRPAPVGAQSAQHWVDLEGGLIEVGHGSDGFSFDNELPRHQQWVAPFRIADRLVTNGEWLEFVADGGYDRPELWLSDGWATVRRESWRAPLYWRERDGAWFEHTLHGTVTLDPHLPVCHVSHYEADAFATWAGHRLPTEAEWEHAADDPRLRQVFGTCWQWTASAYLPYPGFHPAAGAVGEYNGKFMSSQMVLRGSSALTPPGHARSTYRNFFPPAARWPMTGVRLAATA